jgi:hypothetical protein
MSAWRELGWRHIWPQYGKTSPIVQGSIISKLINVEERKTTTTDSVEYRIVSEGYIVKYTRLYLLTPR